MDCRPPDGSGACLDHASRLTSVTFDPDGKILATGTAAQLGFRLSRKGEIRFWNVESGTVMLPFGQFSRSVRCLAFRPDGKVLASASDFSGPSVNSEVALTGRAYAGVTEPVGCGT